MKKSRFTDSQIIAVLKQAEDGMPVPEICREQGISSATFYKWRNSYLESQSFRLNSGPPDYLLALCRTSSHDWGKLIWSAGEKIAAKRARC